MGAQRAVFLVLAVLAILASGHADASGDSAVRRDVFNRPRSAPGAEAPSAGTATGSYAVSPDFVPRAGADRPAGVVAPVPPTAPSVPAVAPLRPGGARPPSLPLLSGSLPEPPQLDSALSSRGPEDAPRLNHSAVTSPKPFVHPEDSAAPVLPPAAASRNEAAEAAKKKNALSIRDLLSRSRAAAVAADDPPQEADAAPDASRTEDINEEAKLKPAKNIRRAETGRTKMTAGETGSDPGDVSSGDSHAGGDTGSAPQEQEVRRPSSRRPANPPRLYDVR